VQQKVDYLVMMLFVLILGDFYRHYIMLGRGVPIVQIHEQWYKENHPGGILRETWKCRQKKHVVNHPVDSYDLICTRMFIK
jgi:hypothetical protein